MWAYNFQTNKIARNLNIIAFTEKSSLYDCLFLPLLLLLFLHHNFPRRSGNSEWVILRPATFLKRDYNTGYSYEYCEVFRNTYLKEHLCTDASELTLGSDCLKLYFLTVYFKTILTQYHVILKHNMAHMPSLNLTPGLSCEDRFHRFIIKVYYTKRKCL